MPMTTCIPRSFQAEGDGGGNDGNGDGPDVLSEERDPRDIIISGQGPMIVP